MSTVIPNYDFVWQQGEDGVIDMVYKQDSVPVDLTGYKLRMDVVGKVGTQTYTYTFNSDDIVDGTLNDTVDEATLGADGTIHIVVPRSVTLAGGPLTNAIGTALEYDIFLRDTNDKQRKILRGTITIEASNTLWT